MTLINFDNPVLWRPSNAHGMAVHISGTMNDEPLNINLYWSGLMMTHKGFDEKAILAQADGFQKNFIPRDEQTTLHFTYNGEEFVPITDPHWVPGVKSF